MSYLISNYHTHTTRCMHAYDTEREYIEKAIQCGIKILGFSDHAPVPYRNGFVSGIRMTMEQGPEYVSCLKKLKKEYEDQIQIRIGFEAEYLKEYFEEQMAAFEEWGIDYLILGQHFNSSEMTGPYNAHETRDRNQLTDYVNTVLEAAATGRYSYIAHPDILNFVGDEKFYRQEFYRMCQGLKELQIPLEMNILGKATQRNYPSDTFFELAGEVGNEVILGLDAHCANQIDNPQTVSECKKMVERYHLNLITEI